MSNVLIVTGSAGLIGSESVRFFAQQGLDIVGIDNDMRAHFFGQEASTHSNRLKLEQQVQNYRHLDTDIRDPDSMLSLFKHYRTSIAGIIHTAHNHPMTGQPVTQ